MAGSLSATVMSRVESPVRQLVGNCKNHTTLTLKRTLDHDQAIIDDWYRH